MPASWWLAGHCVHKMQKGAALGALSLPCKICFILTNKLKERAPIKLLHVVILSTQMSDRSLGASTAGRHCSEAESPKREHVALAPIHSFPRRGLPRSPAQIRPASHVPIAGRLAATRQERISRGSRRPTGDASFHPVRDDATKRGTPHAHRRRHPRTADTERAPERARLG